MLIACAGGSWGTDNSNGNIIPNGNAGNTNKYWFYSFCIVEMFTTQKIIMELLLEI